MYLEDVRYLEKEKSIIIQSEQRKSGLAHCMMRFERPTSVSLICKVKSMVFHRLRTRLVDVTELILLP